MKPSEYKNGFTLEDFLFFSGPKKRHWVVLYRESWYGRYIFYHLFTKNFLYKILYTKTYPFSVRMKERILSSVSGVD